MVREENCLWTRMPRRTMVNLNGRSKVREKEWQSSECEFQVLGSGRGWNRTISSFRSFLATSKLHNETQTEVRPSTEKSEKSGSKTASGHGESWADFETTWNYQLKKKKKERNYQLIRISTFPQRKKLSNRRITEETKILKSSLFTLIVKVMYPKGLINCAWWSKQLYILRKCHFSLSSLRFPAYFLG